MKLIYCLPILLCLACTELTELAPTHEELPDDVQSLEAILDTDIEETTQLVAYAKLVRLLKYEAPDQAHAYADKQLALAESMDNLRYQGKAYHAKGLLLRNSGQYTKALNAYLHAVDLFEQIGNIKFVAADLNNIGYVFLHVEGYNEAIPYFEKAANYYGQTKDYRYQIIALTNLAICESKKAVPDFEKGRSLILEAITVQTNFDNSDHLRFSTLYNELGMVNFLAQDYKIAISNYEVALAHAEKIQQPNNQKVNLYHNLAESYMHLGSEYYSKAQNWVDRASLEKIVSPDNLKLAVLRYNIAGELKQRQGKHHEALAILQQGVDIAEKGIVNEPLQRSLELMDTSQKAIARSSDELSIESIFQVRDLAMAQVTAKETFEGGLNRAGLKAALSKEVEEYHEAVKKAELAGIGWAIAMSVAFLLLLGAGWAVYRARERKRDREAAEAEFRIKMQIFKHMPQ